MATSHYFINVYQPDRAKHPDAWPSMTRLEPAHGSVMEADQAAAEAKADGWIRIDILRVPR